ncbi:MAG TPA: 4-aminobutyrate--2-oxoglutarate transaminase [Candidatus Xenobia bacterium]|jgi:4-aminobutyrate aminotransferase/(S)-3-amino-2-methylpropionate transaminase
MTVETAKSVVRKTEIPGPKSQALMARVEAATPKAVGHITPIAIERARGALLTDVDGNTYIDFAGGIGVLNVGHCPPEVASAIQDQSEKYLHLCFMLTVYEPYVALCEKLNSIVPGNFPKKSALFNSGAEAVENAVKVARAYTGRPGVVCFERSFHGRTLLALSMTGQVAPYKSRFSPYVPDVHHIPYPYTYRSPQNTPGPEVLEELFRAHASPDSIAALVVEPVLGEGGFLVPPAGYLKALQAICKKHGILFIADEVQSGFGRTGKMFASEHFDIEPDIVVTAKSMAAGTPLAAVTGRAEIMDSNVPGSLGGTYGGNPVACRAALAAIELLEKGLLARGQEIGKRVLARFQNMQEKHALIGDVRGLGAMLAIELVKDRQTREPATEKTAALMKTCYQNGLLVLKAGAQANVIRALMPFAITDAQLEEGLDILDQALGSVS